MRKLIEKRKKHIGVLMTLIFMMQLMTPWNVSAAVLTSSSDEPQYPIEEAIDGWRNMSDEELNRYFDNNGGRAVSYFLYSLSPAERREILLRDTALTRETEYESSSGVKRKMPYYRYVETVFPKIMSFASYSKASGYCYFKFKYDGRYVTYKVEFTINSSYVNKADGSSSVPYTIAVTTTSGSNASLKNSLNATISKNYTYSNMQKALTPDASEGIASTAEYSSSLGKTIYKTKIWQVFVLNIRYNKPAYTYATAETTNTVTSPRAQRFNLKSYNWQNTNASTLDKGVYHSSHTETVTSQVNMRNAGIQISTESGAKNATMTISFEHPELNINYNKNSASASGISPVSGTRPYDGTSRKLKTVLSDCGFSWSGHYITASEAWKNSGTYWSSSSPGYRADEIQDFTDGTYFTSKSKVLYANWKVSSGGTTTDPDPTPDPTPSTDFTIYYNANGGTGAPGATTITGSGDISSTTPTRSGYNFIGWSRGASVTSPRISYTGITAADGTTSRTTMPSWGKTEYGNALGTSIGSTLTLYAQWESAGSSGGSTGEGFWIFFDANGGTGGPDYVRTTGTTDIPSTVPTREGYRFMGWGATQNWCTQRIIYSGGKTARDGTTARTTGTWTKSQYELYSGMTFYNISSGPDDEYPYAGFLYAQWEENENEPPVITAPDRVFFLHETVDLQELLKKVTVSDKEDGTIASSNYKELNINRLNEDGTKTSVTLGSDDFLDTSDSKLKYEVKVKYEDSGKAAAEKTFNVTIAAAPAQNKKRSYPRFISLEMIETLDSDSIWRTNNEYRNLLLESLNRTEPVRSYEVDIKKEA